MLEKIGSDEEDVIGKKYKIYDLYEEKNEHEYDNLMNLYDYVGDSITVTGIADAEEEDCDVLLCDEVYDEIQKDFVFFISGRIGIKTNNFDRAINILLKNDCVVDDPFLNEAYGLDDTREKYGSFIVLILSALVFASCAIIISFITFFINDNSKNIGILKSLGYDYKELKFMFIVNQIKNVLISDMVGFTTFLISVKVLNQIKRKGMLTNPYDFIKVNGKITAIVMLLFVIYSLFAALFPLKKIDKMTIIDAIRKG